MNRAAAALLFFSGATGLVYEVAWSKVLADVLGNSGQAHAIVLASFMGGLALGAWLLGGLADRVRRPLLIYAAIEGAVGAYALAFPQVQQGLEALFLSVAPAFSESWRALPKLVVAACALAPPAIAMGGTMPAMIRHVLRGGDTVGHSLAQLYAVNSLGAAAGAWLTGTVWLPSLGLAATSQSAGLVNLTLAAASLVVERLFDAVPHPRPVPPTEPTVPARGVTAAIVGLVLSGFTSMLFETGWIRLVTLVVGASTYAFTWIVTAFIFGIALGSFWFSRRAGPPSLAQFGRLQALVALAVSVSLPLYLVAPYLFLRVRVLLAQRVEAFPAYQLVLFGVSLAVMVIPTFFMGAAFPAGARLVARASETAGKRLGLVWAANTVGTVLGALLGGLWLMPSFGLETLFIIGLVLTWLGATVALWASPGSPRRLVPSLVAAVALVLTAASSAGWASLLARLSPFRAALAAMGTLTFSEYVDTRRDAVVQDFVRDDTFATVFVGHERRNPSKRFLLVNGKADASTDSGDLVTQTMLGQLGVLLAPKPVKQVMMVGAGSGVSLAGTLASDAERVDLVEISPAVLEAARRFGDVNHKALEDPRVHVHLDDARTFLLLEPRTYDVIVSEPSNPWVSGISSLFTQEFFEIVDRRLAPDGLLVQWFHTYEMNDELVKLVLRTLRTRFPSVTGWQGGGGDLVLIASRRPFAVDFQQLAARLQAPGVKALLSPLRIEGVEGVLALEQVSTEGLLAWAGAGGLNSDDKNVLEYRAPVAFFADQDASPPDERRRPSRFARLELSRYLELNPLDAAAAARVHFAVSSGQNDDSPLRRSSAAAWMRLAPEDPAPREAYAKVALEQGEADAARAALEPLVGEGDRLLQSRAALADHRKRAAPFRALPPPELLEAVPPPPKSPPALPEMARPPSDARPKP